MKLTNEDLRRIILEEIEKVLSEFHDGIDGKTDNPLLQTKEKEESEPITSSDLGRGLEQAGKELQKDPEMRRDVNNMEGGKAAKLMSDIMKIITKKGDATPLINKIDKAIEPILKAEDK